MGEHRKLDKFIPPSAKGAERRRSVRYSFDLETSSPLIATVEYYPWSVKVRNISAGGISLVVRDSFAPGTVLTVDLLNTNKMFTCKVQVRVIYAVEHPNGDWILGGAFTRNLDDHELRALLA